MKVTKKFHLHISKLHHGHVVETINQRIKLSDFANKKSNESDQGWVLYYKDLCVCVGGGGEGLIQPSYMK